MKRWIAVMLSVAATMGVGRRAAAQDVTPGEGTVLVTIFPGGATFFTAGKDSSGPSFGDYGLGGAVTLNLNRYVGFEGEVSGSLGVTQDLQFGGLTSSQRTPNLLTYSGDVIVSAANRSTLTPYAAVGIGGLTLFDKPGLGIPNTETFLTTNAGGGLKWLRGRWGLRGDYRFVAVQSKDDAPAFFGRETRYGHRVYGGVLINVQ